MKRSLFIITIISLLVVLQSFIPDKECERDPEFVLRTGPTILPMGYNNMFAGSGECFWCHKGDTVPGGHGPLVMIDTAVDNDVSPIKDWQSTMMANSAKDPYWRAKVSHEVLINPALQTEIEHTCTKCHAPQGHFKAMEQGAPTYSIADMISDSLALDGVSCTACHSQRPDSIDIGFSGDLHYSTDYSIYGPYTDPDTLTMLNHINYLVQYSPHIRESALCSSCHTLITEPVDLSGVPTGGSFVEQATYHEWLNSTYVSIGNKRCQGCHIPRITTPINLAFEPDTLPWRSPFGLHHLVGGNVQMLQLMRDHIDTLGLTTTTAHFDTTITRTIRNLQEQSLTLGLTETTRTPDTVFYELELTNQVGHKFPSGYPSRRLFVEFVVLDDIGDTLFRSGVIGSNGVLPDIDTPYEPHHEMINQQDQVQVYEMVIEDIGGNITTILERMHTTVKDNRLVPLGFSSSHSVYDTTRIEGAATSDPDFNYSGATEGTGADIVHYHIPLAGYTGDLNVRARVYYQAVPPEWVAEMFTASTPEIDLFEWMYSAADNQPTLVQQAWLGNYYVAVPEHEQARPKLYPNPTHDGIVRIDGLKGGRIESLRVFDLNGKLVWEAGNSEAVFILPDEPGLYLVDLTVDGVRHIERVIRK